MELFGAFQINASWTRHLLTGIRQRDSLQWIRRPGCHACSLQRATLGHHRYRLCMCGFTKVHIIHICSCGFSIRSCLFPAVKKFNLDWYILHWIQLGYVFTKTDFTSTECNRETGEFKIQLRNMWTEEKPGIRLPTELHGQLW